MLRKPIAQNTTDQRTRRIDEQPEHRQLRGVFFFQIRHRTSAVRHWNVPRRDSCEDSERWATFRNLKDHLERGDEFSTGNRRREVDQAADRPQSCTDLELSKAP